MKGLPSLIRLHKWKLEGRRRQLAELEGLSRNISDHIRQLESDLVAESRLAGEVSETVHAMGNYVQESLARKHRLQESIVQVGQQISDVRAEVSAAFQELKRYELVEERQRASVQAAMRRRERNAEDEVAINVFRRGAKGAG